MMSALGQKQTYAVQHGMSALAKSGHVAQIKWSFIVTRAPVRFVVNALV